MIMSVGCGISSGRWTATSLNNWSLDNLVDLGTNLLDFVFSVEVSLNNLVSLDETIKFSLKFSVLFSEEFLMSQKGIQVLTEIMISLDKGLVAISHAIEVFLKAFDD